jgi:hypothetical protein
MAQGHSHDRFSEELIELLEETFEKHHGIYLDNGTGLFETLQSLSAEEASIPIGSQCATIAAQVEHIVYYLEVLSRSITGEEGLQVDWNEIWNAVSTVSSPAWENLKMKLKTSYFHLRTVLSGIDDWDHAEVRSSSMAIVVHTAYHLGEIRQALCTLKQDR